MKLPEMTIHEIQRALAAGELSAKEIARHTLENIARVNPQINAWTHVSEKRMLAEAENIDTLRREKKPLPRAGRRSLCGEKSFRCRRTHDPCRGPAAERSPRCRCRQLAVRQLHSAGALLSGMLNMDAYAYGFTTENSHYGATRNPHDLSRIAGGSSGGSAAAVAAGLVHFSLGSDTNGSIRVPASLCGIFGLKPDPLAACRRSGSHPFVASLDHIGPFARCVSDLSAVYDALQGRDPGDGFQADKASERTANLLSRGLEGRAAPPSAVILQRGAITMPVRPSLASPGRWRRMRL